MFRDVTLRARAATGRHRLSRRAREEQRVAAFVTAIAATATVIPTDTVSFRAVVVPPLPVAPQRSPGRTDTVQLPRIVATAAAQL